MEDSAGFGQRKLRITTWNGIHSATNRGEKGGPLLHAMFDILEADIVILQETKIQRKDLRDDMVLVPGWDIYFSLPKHKKGYSGVAIYTRSSVCAPIKAEEGITGVLTPPNSSTSFYDLPKGQQIGGYPRSDQLEACSLDSTTLDSEGRCVIVEFPAFILIGVYCPANRDESRDDFRIGFLNMLDIRVRNLVALGKRVLLAGDLNIIRDAIDTANAAEQLKKNGLTVEEYISTPARRMLNQLVTDGRVIGNRDVGKEYGLMSDICRVFHPERAGMFTCWEQKVNARPGNFGSRIDYVLCNEAWSNWFCDADIQEGLMGSDHCPVFATLKGSVPIDGQEVDIRDVMSSGMYLKGVKTRDWSVKDLLRTSAKLIPEFDRRRSIRDMFIKNPTIPTSRRSLQVNDTRSLSKPRDTQPPEKSAGLPRMPLSSPTFNVSSSAMQTSESTKASITGDKGLHELPESRPTAAKRQRSSTADFAAAPSAKKSHAIKGQRSLAGFFRPMNPGKSSSELTSSFADSNGLILASTAVVRNDMSKSQVETMPACTAREKNLTNSGPDTKSMTTTSCIDSIDSKDIWSKILGKRIVPKCQHDEPCISQLTKKSGINCGRSFYMCSRPLGPSGKKERNTPWRCGTFIWSSDWTSDGA